MNFCKFTNNIKQHAFNITATSGLYKYSHARATTHTKTHTHTHTRVTPFFKHKACVFA